ncbi:MAG: hypothetical protein Q9Q40_08060 [Acidobacteriota bacterium]|nr:hypothetical protein [Acidobacteriota bacterium]MDQ7086665.1 hypothetical protein [Acidobacteriota bacterium]
MRPLPELRSGMARTLLVLAGALTAVGVWQTARSAVECRALGRRQIQLEAHRRAVAPRPAPGAAPFATWSHLVAALHQVAAEVPLVRITYRTGEVLPVSAEGGPPGTPASGDARFRAMTATVRGSGDYEEIVAFVGALARSDPPLELLRLRIEAAPRYPRFVAQVYMVTALHVQAPALLRLAEAADREPGS